MKKNSLRSAMAAVACAAVSLTAASMNAFAAADYGFSADQIANCPDKAYVTLTKKVITIDDARTIDEEGKAHGNNVQIAMNVTGADMKYAASGFHVHYDGRLELTKDARKGSINVIKGEAVADIAPGTPIEDDIAANYNINGAPAKGFFVCTMGDQNWGADGTMWTAEFKLPDDVVEGDVFAFDIMYQESKVNEDLFTNKEKDDVGNLMQAFVFTQGIYNAETNNNFAASDADKEACKALNDIDPSFDGYIAIKDAPQAEETTTTTTVVTAATTTTVVSGETTTTAKPGTTVSAAKTTKPAGNAPQTGVAGVGVAVAGLAVALGTAFVLRKKED